MKTRSFFTLFGKIDSRGRLVIPDQPVLRLVAGFFQDAKDRRASDADIINALSRELGGEMLVSALGREFFDLLVSGGVDPARLTDDTEREKFYLDNFMQVLLELATAIDAEIRRVPGEIFPQARNLARGLPIADTPESRAELAEKVRAADRFAGGSCFAFTGEKLIPVTPDSRKPIGKFFGFPGVRAILADHFQDFAAGISHVPLLIHSLPGYGKTSMTISFALENPGNIVVLAPPEALDSANWKRLTALLAARPDKRIVLFFDDIEPDRVDWYAFRTHVGGAFSLPEHILPVLSSNYEFPASILSRGRSVTFPVFDELRCAEMIEDFLRDFGLKNPPERLVMLLGADYTEAFGQKKYTELSPRTLMRHLEVYHRSQSKRRQLAELAEGELITKPDPTLFYEFNINLMRSLYGDDYIARLREEKLRNL